MPCLRLLLHHIAAVQRRSLRRKGKEQFSPGSIILLHINKTRLTWKYPSSMLLLFLHEIVGRGLPLAPQLIIASSCGNNMVALLLPVPAIKIWLHYYCQLLRQKKWLHCYCQDANNILLLLILLPGREAGRSTATWRGSPSWRRTRPQGWWPASPSGGLAIFYPKLLKNWSTLWFPREVTRADGREYTCVASNKFGSKVSFSPSLFWSLPLEWKQAMNLTLAFCVRSVRLFHVDLFPGLFPSHFISYMLLLSFIFIFNKSPQVCNMP